MITKISSRVFEERLVEIRRIFEETKRIVDGMSDEARQGIVDLLGKTMSRDDVDRHVARQVRSHFRGLRHRRSSELRGLLKDEMNSLSGPELQCITVILAQVNETKDMMKDSCGNLRACLSQMQDVHCKPDMAPQNLEDAVEWFEIEKLEIALYLARELKVSDLSLRA